MGRPRLEIGTYGKIRTWQVGPKSWRAETYYRDLDGVTRSASKTGSSATGAARNLKAALKDRQRVAPGELRMASSFQAAGEMWLAEVERTQRGSTFDRYRTLLRNRMIPSFAGLSLRELSTSRCHLYLRQLERQLAPNTVRQYRTVLSGVMGFAVQMGALDRNPVEGTGTVHGGNTRATKRALTPDEREDFLDKLDADRRAVEDDLPDVLRYLMGTGVRIAEAMGLRWVRVDLEEGVCVHGDNLVRETGKGLVLHEPKTPAGYRVLPLPDFVKLMLQLRYPGPGSEETPVFPASIAGGWRDPNNTSRSIRKFRSAAGYEWFTSHVCRRTAITIMDEQGLTPREISGYSGHAKPSFTMDNYMDVKQQSPRAGRALDSAMRPRREVREPR